MTNFIRIVPAIVLAIGIGDARQDLATTQTAATEKVLIANERGLITAVANADKASLVPLVLPNGIWAVKEGFVPMELFVNGLGDISLKNWEIVNPHIQWIDGNSAIVVYALTGGGTVHHQPFGPTTLASTVWTRRNGKWQAFHHQETDLVKQ